MNMNSQRRRSKRALGRLLLVCIITVAAEMWTPLVWAASINVGSITVRDGYPKKIEGATLGGENMSAIFNVDLSQTCLKGYTVHWIQLATITPIGLGPVLPPTFVGPPAPNLGRPTFPNAKQFIDPIPGQDIGGLANDTPFYDVTYNNIADIGMRAKRQTDGTGRIFVDGAGLFWTTVAQVKPMPVTETFQTILVATDGNSKSLLELGGFTWGFTLNQNKTTDLSPVTALTYAQLNSGWAAALNNTSSASLAYFTGYTLSQAICDGNPLVVTFSIPEPSTIVMALLGIPGVIVVTSGYRRRRTA
jgi:hypothetical protein